MVALKELVNRVYTPRPSPFHWSLESCVETVQDRSSLIAESSADSQRTVARRVTASPSAFQFTYDIGSFVTVNGGDDEHNLDFWVGEVTAVKHSTDTQKVTSVTVIWYISYGSPDIYNSKYKPWPSHTADGIASYWKDEVSVETIHTNFAALTKEKRLPMGVTSYVKGIISKRMTTT